MLARLACGTFVVIAWSLWIICCYNDIKVNISCNGTDIKVNISYNGTYVSFSGSKMVIQ